ncbi:hypothetical protein ACFVAD_10400 [Sutcliffiella sp. NPDC057660]|uniref:hypothetical protein n=1 Tax=Sutcliffiella sp. NPDC057660 TaxID=3346199 RepID=UPI0036C6C943
MVKKLVGLFFLISTFIMSLLFVKNFFYPIPVASTRPPKSFMENAFGIFEPKGSLILLFLATFFLGLALYFLLNLSIKKIGVITGALCILIAIFPFFLILLHFGEI